MKKKLLLLFLPLLISLLIPAFSTFASQQNTDEAQQKFHPRELIVKLRAEQPLVAKGATVPWNALDKKNLPKALLTLNAIQPITTVRNVFSSVYTITFASDAPVISIVQDLNKQRDEIVYAQPNYDVSVQFAPNDPYYSSSNSWGQGYDDLWGYKPDRLDLEHAWDTTRGKDATGASVLVATVDTGIDYNHQDLGSCDITQVRNDQCPQVAPGGWDFVSGDDDPYDDHGHGSHVGGIIAAKGNNRLGVVGTAFEARILPIKAFDSGGSGTIDNAAAGITWAADHGATVINNSWVCSQRCPSNPVAEDAVRYAIDRGSVVVFAAGSLSGDWIRFYSPQNMRDPKPIVIGASTQGDGLYFRSYIGVGLDAVAPGGGSETSPANEDPYRDILSLKSYVCNTTFFCPSQLIVGSVYLRQLGTSMSAAYTSGVAALIKSIRSQFTHEDVRQAIRVSAEDIDLIGFDANSGAGRVNASGALGVESVLYPKITSPAHLSKLVNQNGAVAIEGYAYGNLFSSYQLFYARRNIPDQWTAIGPPVTTPAPTAQTLGSWDISSILLTDYYIRLTATDSTGRTYHDLITVTIEPYESIRITNKTGNQRRPSISGNVIVWEDESETPSNSIYACEYDESTKSCPEHLIATSEEGPTAPEVSGSRIVWKQKNGGLWSVYTCLFNAITGECPKFTVISGSADSRLDPSVDGDRIAWSGLDLSSGNIDIYTCVFNNQTGACPAERITFSLANQLLPKVSGNTIVWEDYQNGNADIYGYDLAGRTQFPVVTEGADQYAPSISGTIVAWEDYRNHRTTNCTDIFYKDLSTGSESQVASVHCWDYKPNVDGNDIVWYADANVFLYNTIQQEEVLITAGNFAQVNPAKSGDNIVIEDATGLFGSDISLYTYRMNEPTPTPTPTPPPNSAPVIPNQRMDQGTVGQSYRDAVLAFDPDMTDVLTMTFDPLTIPPGLRQGQCIQQEMRGKNAVGCYLRGTPSAAGDYSLQVTVTDDKGASTTRALRVRIL